MSSDVCNLQTNRSIVCHRHVFSVSRFLASARKKLSFRKAHFAKSRQNFVHHEPNTIDEPLAASSLHIRQAPTVLEHEFRDSHLTNSLEDGFSQVCDLKSLICTLLTPVAGFQSSLSRSRESLDAPVCPETTHDTGVVEGARAVV